MNKSSITLNVSSDLNASKILALNVFIKVLIFIFYSSLFFLFLSIPKIYDFISSEFIHDKTITIYSFTEVFPLELFSQFEEKTGIKVTIKYFDTNEELLAKFKISKGEGYDLIASSDYAIELLCRENLLQKINKDLITNLKQLDSRLLGKYFDPENEYSLPLVWSSYGILFNKNIFKYDDVTWDLVFRRSEKNDYKICMLDEPLESVFLASIYLFSKSRELSDYDLEKIEALLSRQKEWVESYTISNIEYFLRSNIVPIAVVPSYVAKHIVEQDSNFSFKVPSGGSLLSIENLAIPIRSRKSDLVYTFIDFITSKEVSEHSSFHIGFNPVNISTFSLPGVKFLKEKGLFPDHDTFDTLHMINNDLSLEKVSDIWLNVRLF